MTTRETIKLNRDCQAVLVPAGTPILIPAETEVTITQELGTSFTVTLYGNLARIAAQDADALGKPVKIPEVALPEGTELTEAFIIEQLKTCYDPEIPVNIVDLGLIYGCQIIPITDESYEVKIQMTLTAPACGIGPVLIADVEEKIRMIPCVEEVHVELVFDPPWSQDRMSVEAKLQLGLL